MEHEEIVKKVDNLIYPKKTKGFGYQVLGFGAGGQALGLIEATGGTIVDCGLYRIHKFTGTGTFQVTHICACTPSQIDYLVILTHTDAPQYIIFTLLMFLYSRA